MNRRRFLHGLTVSLLAVPLAAEGQRPGKLPRIAFVYLGSPPPEGPRVVGPIVRGLRKLG